MGGWKVERCAWFGGGGGRREGGVWWISWVVRRLAIDFGAPFRRGWQPLWLLVRVDLGVGMSEWRRGGDNEGEE